MLRFAANQFLYFSHGSLKFRASTYFQLNPSSSPLITEKRCENLCRVSRWKLYLWRVPHDWASSWRYVSNSFHHQNFSMQDVRTDVHQYRIDMSKMTWWFAHHPPSLCLKPGTGVALCIEKALVQSGVNREDVNYINAYATSTPTGDLKEYRALIRCFGNNPEVKTKHISCHWSYQVTLVLKNYFWLLQLRVNSTKSMIGHLLGASGAVEAVATIKVSQPHVLISSFVTVSALLDEVMRSVIMDDNCWIRKKNNLFLLACKEDLRVDSL